MIRVTYDDRRTDPESLGMAISRFLEAALSTAGVMEDHGGITVGPLRPTSVVAGMPRRLYRYSYRNPDGTPLRRCPHCDADLLAPAGIDLVLSVDGHVLTVPSRLDRAGDLEDTEDGAIAAGFHSATNCGACGESLIDWEHPSEEEPGL
jgi:hypothetical protein